MMRALGQKLRHYRDDESATATLELAIVFPLLMIVFVASFESALILTRQIMLERVLDMSTRVLRLTQGVNTNAEAIRQTMCANTSILRDCESLLSIDLIRIDRTTYEMPSDNQICANRGADEVVAPENEFEIGMDNDFMLIRTCLVVDPILPMSGFGLNLTRDDSGALHMIATTIFVNEPD